MSFRLDSSDPPGGGPGQQPDMPPTRPNDPAQPEPLPLPPDSPRPTAPVREPEPAPAQPAGDPAPSEPTRLAGSRGSSADAKPLTCAPAAWEV